jgi:hypothetical protein
MRTPLALLALVVCALPLLAQKAERRVVAPCELIAASLSTTGRENAAEGREFAIRVTNKSTRTIALPRSPVFGWRVETQDKNAWRFKAEGGPVHRVNAKDEHIVAFGNPADAQMMEIAPARSADFYTFLPGTEKALQPESQLSTLKLTVYWAASAALTQSNRAVPSCALASEWVITMQRPALPK